MRRSTIKRYTKGVAITATGLLAIGVAVPAAQAQGAQAQAEASGRTAAFGPNWYQGTSNNPNIYSPRWVLGTSAAKADASTSGAGTVHRIELTNTLRATENGMIAPERPVTLVIESTPSTQKFLPVGTYAAHSGTAPHAPGTVSAYVVVGSGSNRAECRAETGTVTVKNMNVRMISPAKAGLEEVRNASIEFSIQCGWGQTVTGRFSTSSIGCTPTVKRGGTADPATTGSTSVSSPLRGQEFFVDAEDMFGITGRTTPGAKLLMYTGDPSLSPPDPRLGGWADVSGFVQADGSFNIAPNQAQVLGRTKVWLEARIGSGSGSTRERVTTAYVGVSTQTCR